MINCNQKIKFNVNINTNEIVDKTGDFHNITDEMFNNGWVRVWWQENYAEVEGLTLENIGKAVDLLINMNILKNYNEKDYHLIYSIDNEWYHTVLKGRDL